jgi:hypothetical protein
MKLLIITAATVGLIALCAVWSSAAEPNKKTPDTERRSPEGPRHRRHETGRHAKDAYRAKKGVSRAFEKLAFAL